MGNPILAIIFDFNGVLVDDEPLHCRAFQTVLEQRSLALSEQEYRQRYLPFDDRAFFQNFYLDRSLKLDESELQALIHQKSEVYLSLLAQGIPTIEDTLDFLGRLPETLPLAIASGAAGQEIELILKQLGLRERFQVVISSEDVSQSKPHPEAFLKAFALIQKTHPELIPSSTVVVEDSFEGIRSAHEAGLKCVALTTSFPAKELSQADLVLASLKGWDLERLQVRLETIR